LAALLLLPGCGRKGPLDLPPGASYSQPGALGAPGAGGGVAPTREAPQFDEEGRPIAPAGQKRRLFLDWLLD
jgi:predicted small lipoprotein YifL